MNPSTNIQTPARRPIEELKAGNDFRDSLVSRADFDDQGVPYWCGWALMDAFLAGIDYARANIAKHAPSPSPVPTDGLEMAARAFDDFSKSVSSLPGDVQVAMQQHDQTWNAWKVLCHAMAALKGNSLPAPAIEDGDENYTAEQLKELLNWRDMFIVEKGLWSEFVHSLDKPLLQSTTPPAASLGQVPDGWMLVPRVPTRNMTMAACDRLPSCEHVFGHAGALCAEVYKAMLTATPPSPVDDRVKK